MDNLNVGIIGFGFIGKTHLENLLKMPELKVKSVFSTVDEREQIPKDISFYTDYKQMINKENLDVALVCTPTFTHEDIVCNCAANGLDIFLEKPMALSLKECNAILDSTKQNNVKIMIGHVLRFWPTYGSVREFIINNRSQFGEFQSITAMRLGTYPWSKWFADQSKSGGVILDLSIHDIDYAMWLMGEVVSVSCYTHKITKHGMDVQGESRAILNFKSLNTAECEASWAKPSGFPFFTYSRIEGENEVIELDGDKIFDNEKWKIKNVFSSEDGYYNELEHFFEGLSKKTTDFLVTGEDGKKAVKICLAAIKSGESEGKIIYIDDIE